MNPLASLVAWMVIASLGALVVTVVVGALV